MEGSHTVGLPQEVSTKEPDGGNQEPVNRINRDFPTGGGIYVLAEIDLPREETHDTRGDLFSFWKSIYPGGKTPCECFQAEKVVRGGKPFGEGGTPTKR